MLFALIKRLMSVRQEMGWVVFGQLVAFLGGVATIKLLTNIMSAEEYGLLALGLTIAGLYNMFVFGPLGQSVLRFFSLADEQQLLSDYVLSIKHLHFQAVRMILFIVILPAGVASLFFDSHWLMMVLLATLYGVAAGIHSSLLSMQTAMRHRKRVAMHQAVFVWFCVMLAIGAMLVGGKNSVVAMFGMTAGAVLTVLSEWYFIRRDECLGSIWCDSSYVDHGRSLGKEIFSYSYSFVYFSAFAAISMYADRWILQSLYGPDTVGIYAALFLIASAPVTLLMGVVNQLMVPILFQKAGAVQDEDRQQNSLQMLLKVFFITATVCLPIVMVTWLAGGDIVRLLSNADYAQYADALWLMVLGLCVFNLGQILVIKGLNVGNPRIYIFAKAMQAVVFVVVAYALAIWDGVYGVAIALVISSFAYLLLVIRSNRQIPLLAV